MIQEANSTEIVNNPQGELICQICQESKVLSSRKYCTAGHEMCICINCGEQSVDSYIQGSSSPLLCIRLDCSAPLDKQQGSFFSFLSEKNKEWIEQQQLAISQQNSKNSSCKEPNCTGIIVKNGCLLCRTRYCLRCDSKEHTGSCPISILIPGLQIIQCPSCRQRYSNERGCNQRKCFKCGHQWCNICKESWNREHHFCKGPQGLLEAFKGWFRQRSLCFAKVH